METAAWPGTDNAHTLTIRSIAASNITHLRLAVIKALEAADAGDLALLASLFARLERTAIMQALSIDTDKEVSYHHSLTSALSCTNLRIRQLN